MSGLLRVAVQVGASAVRLAVEQDGRRGPVVERPVSGPPSIGALIADLVGPPVGELLLVHPGAWSPDRAAEHARRHGGLADVVRAVPAPLAAAGPGPVAVLDVGASTAEASVLDGAGRVVACWTGPVGGDTLDGAVRCLIPAPPEPVPAGYGPADPRGQGLGVEARSSAEAVRARQVREALSLLPACAGLSAEEVRGVLAGPLRQVVDTLAGLLDGPLPVLLIGGVARTPLLAELLDEAGIDPVSVAPRPDAAAVLGALTLPADLLRATCPPATRGSAHAQAAAAPHRRLPRPPPRRPLRIALAVVTGVAVGAGLFGAGTALIPQPAAAVPAGTLVQYGYRFDVPAGWEHTGGLPERRRSLLTPVTTPDGSDLIAVELSRLGYDATAEPERAAAELRAEFDAAAARPAPSRFTGYDPAAAVAGRPVTAYRQVEERTEVDWYVLLDGDAQLSVGCRHTPASAAAVEAACAVVVGSLARD